MSKKRDKLFFESEAEEVEGLVDTPEFHEPLPEDAVIPVPQESKDVASDTLLGDPIEGEEEGKYFHVQPGCTKPNGFWRSGAGVDIPRVIHIPTGSKWSYIKIHVTLQNGTKMLVWKRHDKVV